MQSVDEYVCSGRKGEGGCMPECMYVCAFECVYVHMSMCVCVLRVCVVCVCLHQGIHPDKYRHTETRQSLLDLETLQD